MSVEGDLDKKYLQIRAEEEQYQKNLTEARRKATAIKSSIVFFAHYPAVAYLIALAYNAIYIIEKGTHLGSTMFAAYAVVGLLIWLGTGVYYWKESWNKKIVDYLEKSRAKKKQIEALKNKEKERADFLRFYQLYKTDPEYRASYDEQFGSKKWDELEKQSRL